MESLWFCSLDLTSQQFDSKSNVAVMTPGPWWTAARFHLILTLVESGVCLNCEFPRGRSKRSTPELMLFSFASCFLDYLSETQSVVRVLLFSFPVRSLLTFEYFVWFGMSRGEKKLVSDGYFKIKPQCYIMFESTVLVRTNPSFFFFLFFIAL